MKKVVRINESELKKIISKSVKKILKEEIDYRSVSDWNDDLSNTDDLYDYDEVLGNAKENLRMQGISASLHHPTTTPWASDDPNDLGSMDSLDVLYAKPDELERRVNKQKTQVYPSELEESIRNIHTMNRTIRLRESELRRMISECVRRVLRESTETMVFGLPLSIISDNNDSITIQYDGNEYTIEKHGNFDATTRYIYLGDKYYEDIGFAVNDGYAICKGDYLKSKMVDTNSKYFGDLTDQDNSKDDVIEAYFPKLRQILTNEKLLEQTLYYFSEQNYDMLSDEDNILKAFLESDWDKDVAMFFEGLFFGGGNIQWKINGKNV